MAAKRILVTGASGFIGRHAVAALASHGWYVRAVIRRQSTPPAAAEVVTISDLAVDDLTPLVQGMDAVLHLAGRAHVLHETAKDPVHAFHQANVVATRRLWTSAIEAGVRRFIFMSSIGAAIVETELARGTTLPQLWRRYPYQTSKYEAECALSQVTAKTIELVILRPPLVYGPEAPGNLALLLAALRWRLPLPLASLRNQRSFVYVENLVSAILVCLEHPNAAGQVFAVTDGENLTPPELVRRLAQATGQPVPQLVPVPPRWLVWLASLVGRGDQMRRLVEPLEVDATHISKALGWYPPIPVDVGLASLLTRVAHKTG